MTVVDYSDHAIRKGCDLYDAGKVTIRGDSEALVLGEHGVYLVRAFPGGGMTCSCPARGGGCSHIVATLLAWSEALGGTP